MECKDTVVPKDDSLIVFKVFLDGTKVPAKEKSPFEIWKEEQEKKIGKAIEWVKE